MGEIIGTLALLGIVVMIVSPSHLFKKLDKHIFQVPDTDTHISHLNIPQVIVNYYNDEETMNQDERRLSALEGIVASCENPHAKRMWEIKKAEYLRQLKWNRLVEMSDGSERIKGL
jgi:hypothetical protein